MDLLKKTDEEIIKIANPIWDNLVKTSNQKRLWWFYKRFFYRKCYLEQMKWS